MALLRVLVMLLTFTATCASAQVIQLRVAYEDKDTYDHTGSGTSIPEQPGVTVEMVALLPTKLPQLKIQFSRKPWIRCLAELEAGTVDAVFSSSFKPERMKMGLYPMRDGKDDRRFRLDTKSYSLYKLNEAPTQWDGHRFTPPQPRLLAVRGYAIVDDLRKMEQTVNEVSGPEEAMRMLQAGRADGFAQLTDRGDYLLRKNREFANIVKVSPPIVTKDYYLQISHQFQQQHPELVSAIWKALAEIRQAESERLLAKYINME
jgi:polar amino acid transport system substrate-binding protein